MTDQVYTVPIAHDIKKGKQVIRTVLLASRFIEVGGKRYKSCGVDSSTDAGSYLLASIETGEFRWVSGDVIRGWMG